MPNITGLPLTVKNIFSQPDPEVLEASKMGFKEGISRWPRQITLLGLQYNVFFIVNDAGGDPVGVMYQNQNSIRVFVVNDLD